MLQQLKLFTIVREADKLWNFIIAVAGCSLNLKLGDKEPIVVVDNFLALPSDDQGLSLKPGDTVQASCPGSQLGLGKETVTIACEASGELQVRQHLKIKIRKSYYII